MMRTVKRTALSTMKTAGVFSMAGRTRWRHDRLLILAYHGVAQADEHVWDPCLFIAPELLNQRLAFLRSAGYSILSLNDALERMRSGRLPERSVTMTFDDGYVDFYRMAYPILKAHGVPATVYLTTYYSERNEPPPAITATYMLWKRRDFAGRITVIPGFDRIDLRKPECWQAVSRTAARFFDGRRMPGGPKQELIEKLAGEIGFDFAEFRRQRILHLMTPDEARQVASGGIDIQLHTHRHFVPQDEAMVRREVLDNRVRIEAITSKPADHFCYPSGVYFPEMVQWLRKLGIRSATTCDPGLASATDDLLLLPRFLDHSRVTQVEFEAWASGIGPSLPRRMGRIA